MAENTGLTASDVAAGDDVDDTDHNTLVADTKKLRQESMTAGATINGATLPVPVYQNTSDNEVYASDANDTSALGFIGFAITNGTDGNAIIIQHTGIVGGFSALDEGEDYYVQDTVGTIGKSKGTNPILVGVAISPTEILITKKRVIGDSISKTIGTIYKADTDGFVVAFVEAGGAGDRSAIITGITDSNATPTTIVAECAVIMATDTAGAKASVTFPIKKGDYYKTTKGTSSPSSSSMLFVPLN